jgi:DNA polymerase-3 subunit delta
MRFYPKNFDSLLMKVRAGQVNSLLMYGPDKGVLEHFILLIQNALGLQARKVSYSEKNAVSLLQLANCISLFDARELIVLQDCSSSLDKDDKLALEGTLHNFLILVADELSPNSSLRQFFEKHLSLACVPCYYELKSDLKVLVRKYLSNLNKAMTDEALEYVCDNLNNDRQILYNELGKLASASTDVKIDLSLVKELIVPSRSFAIDKLSIAFANNDANGYFSELEDLFAASVSEILVIRSLIRYYTNIYIAKLKVMAGVHLDEAIKALKPPVFFMYINQFKEIMKKIEIPQVLQVLKKLHLSEIELKSTNKHSKNVFENIFYQRG